MNKNNQTMNQWMELNKTLKNSRMTNLGLVAVSFVLGIIFLLNSFKAPIVIQECGEKHKFIASRFKNITVTNDDAKEFVRKFIEYRYIWKNPTPKELIYRVRPLVTEGFSKELFKKLRKNKKKMDKVKSIEQNITNIEVIVDKGKVIATFDKIIRVNGLPLVDPTQLALTILQDEKTPLNPVGLYVHGVIEHSEK